MHDEDKGTSGASASSRRGGFWRRVVGLATRLIIPACILAGAGGFLKYQMDTRPQAQRIRPPREARTVTVETVHMADCRAQVAAMGTVRPAREITLNPEVSGVITRIDPIAVPGGLIEAGRELFGIDSRDYEALLTQRDSEVAQAQLNLKLEAGNQTIAQAEYRMLEEVIGDEDKELVLRKPHLANAQAAMDAAIAAIEKARLDVERCTIRAPFNAIIMEKYVDVGARVSPTSPLLRIIGTDEYWIEAAVSVDELVWLEIPQDDQQEGSVVHVFNPPAWGPEPRRQGRLLRLLGEVEHAGRMAQVLVSVKDPLCVHDDAGQPILLNGSYVRMEIEGRVVPQVITVRRAHLRDGDKVWVMNDADTLEIRPVKIVFRGKETVYVSSGIADGERIVTTDLAVAVQGMPLRILHETPAVDASAANGGGTQQP